MLVNNTLHRFASERARGFYFVCKIHTGVLFVKKPTIFFENVKIIGLIILENVKIMTV